MTNTKQLMSAVALLASITVLDNFIFVELEPGFESMVLIEPYGSPSNAEITQADEQPELLNEANDFWIDKHKVNNADFAKFLDSSSYESQEIIPRRQAVLTNQHEELAVSVSSGKWQVQDDNTNWHKPTDSLAINHTFAGQDNLKVSFRDALAYCNWLDKDLPTTVQSEYIIAKDQDNNVSGLYEFRCVKNN